MRHPPLPAPGETGDTFWRGGEFGELRIGWCVSCAAWRHPSQQFCAECLSEVTETRAASGRAEVLACTVNHQRWVDGVDPPYVIAVVGLSEDPSVRLTTNLVNLAHDDARVGLKVRVVFVRHGNVWLPQFEPDPDAQVTAPLDIASPDPVIRPRHAAGKFEDAVAITGIGSSRIGRRLPRSALALTVDACLAAISDAGLDRTDIDGICAYPGSTGLPGMSQGGVRTLEQALRLHPAWHCGAHEAPGQVGTVIDGMMAVASGLCRHVLCFTSFSESNRPSLRGADNAEPVRGEPAWALPYGCASPVNWLALYASQYCAKYGVDPGFLGHIAVSTRAHAARNPAALYHAPLTLADYRAARMISSPFRLFDCDVPCDGAMAVIVSTRDAAVDLRHATVRVEAVGTRIGEPQSWDQGTLTHQPQVFSAARHMWSRTDLRPDDIDVALLYDGFTFNAVSWIEALGLCQPGEARDWIGDGSRIAPGGPLPLNTHGGHLSAGRTNGYGHLLEAVAQLRNEAAGRQVSGADVAVVTTGGAIPAGCLLLRRDA